MTLGQIFERAAAIRLGERVNLRANDVPSCNQSHTSFPALEIHADKTDPEVDLSHQLGNAALAALQL